MTELSRVEKRARNITKWVGSPTSIILHTLLFGVAFMLAFLGLVSFDRMLLVLTTIVSLEAIYLAIFIQMTINQQSEVIAEVGQDLDEIQEDIEGIQEDVEEIGEDVEELQEDVGEIGEDLDESEDEEKAEDRRKREQTETIKNIYDTMQKLAADIETLKK
jgi:septal ring factor EnvC (AmiA/AmiB activator)